MTWHGDKTLPWTFIPFLMLSSVWIGEVMPVVISIFAGVFDTYGAKEPIIKTLPDFGIVLIIYIVLALLFWLLYRYIAYQIVALFTFILAFILERWVYWHPEGEVGISNTISLRTILTFIIIYFLVLVLPYFIFQAIRKKWLKKGVVISLIIVLVLNLLGLGFTYYTMVSTNWFERHRNQPNSQNDPNKLPSNTCPERMIIEKDKPIVAYLNGQKLDVGDKEQKWVEQNCPQAVELR